MSFVTVAIGLDYVKVGLNVSLLLGLFLDL